ncbi:MAG: FtsQ-type POTRA domain-containing protein [Acidaminococcales bacterium]|nr:FtsQ-type POTRA domain-containing protein [Acidaminococcales bacterium]
MSTYERIQKKRKENRNNIFKKILVFLAGALFLVCGYILLRQPWFSFGAVYITGAEKIRREEILFLTGLKEPANLFIIDCNLIRQSLINDLRIKNALVRYELPYVLHIDIEEKKPVFYVASSYGYVALDAQGLVIGAAGNIKDGAAPVLSGVNIGNGFVGDQINKDEIAQMLAFLNMLDQNVLNNIAEINISGTGKVKIFDLPGRWYIMGGIGELGQKAKSFSAMIKEFAKKNPAVEFADLSYNKPYIKIKR